MRKTYTSALCSIALMALALAGCQQERGLAPDQTPLDGAKVAQFTAGPVTRVVNGTSWEGTEVIGISNVTKSEPATTNVAYKATTAGSTTNFADQGTKLLLPGDNSQVTFAAYYPFASTISEGKASYIISKGSDQPVLFATQSGTADNPKLPFTFKHKLAQVKIKLTAGEGLSLGDLSSVLYRGGVTDVKMNVLTGELTTGNTKGDITLTKEAEGEGTCTYSSYIVPQDVESTFAFVITLGSKTYTLSMDKVNKVPTKLDSGFAYTFKAKLTKDGKMVNPDGSSIGGIDDGGTGDGGDVTPDDPSTPAAAQKLPFTNDFKSAAGIAPFTEVSVSGEQAWRIDDSTYKNGAKMSGYVGGAKNPNEDWLISPALDLSGAMAPELFISHAINHAGDMTSEQQVLISDNYTAGDPSTATWTPLTVTYPAGNNWSYEDSKTDLKAYAGKKNIHIAFKYVSTSTSAAAWQIAKMEVKEATGSEPGTEPGTEEPGTEPEQPTTGNLLFPGADFEDWSAFMSVFTKGNSTGITIEQGNDPTQGGVMKVTGKDSGNKWIFNIQNVQVTNPAPKKITFKVKGTSPSRSFSVVVYGLNGEMAIYNIGDILADKVISEYKTSTKDHKYDGQINTGDQWVTITLDISQVKINNTGSGKIFSAKIGKLSEYNVMLDDFKIE